MKKKLLVVAMFIVVIMTTCLLAGCNTPKMTLGFMASADGTPSYVDVNIKDYDGKMLVDLLKGEKSLGAIIQDGDSPFLAEINGLKYDEQNHTFISIYTNLEEFKATDKWAADPIEKDGVTYFSANVGINQLPISSEAKYLFVQMSW